MNLIFHLFIHPHDDDKTMYEELPSLFRFVIAIYFNIHQINMNISKYKSFIKVVQYTLILLGFAIFISSKNNETTTWEQILVGLFDKITMVFLFMLFSYLNHQMKVKEI